MPNEYISLAERLKQVQEGRRQKFSQMMEPVFNSIEQIRQLKEKEEKEEQQLSAIKNIYGGDVEKYGLELDEYSRESFGTPSNYESYIRKQISSAKPEYTDRLRESKEIAQLKRNFVDAYGEDKLADLDINEQSTSADWKREIEQYGDRLEQKRSKTENIRKVTNQIIGNIGSEAAGKLNLQDKTLPQMRMMLAQTKYQKGQGEGGGEGEAESGIYLTNAQNQKLTLLTDRYDVKPKEGQENRYFTLKCLEALDDIKTHPDNLDEISDENEVLIRDLTGREFGSLNYDESIGAITKELDKHTEGITNYENLPIEKLAKEAQEVYGMQRKNALGSSFESKKEKLEEQLDTGTGKKQKDRLGILD